MTDLRIRQLEYSIAEKDLMIATLQTRLAKTEAMVQELTDEIQVYKGALHEACIDISTIQAVGRARKENKKRYEDGE